MRKKTIQIVGLILYLALIAFLAIRQNFNLAFVGDHWGINYLIWGIFDIRKEASFFNPMTYFCTYCPHYFFMYPIIKLFGYEPFYIALASFISRIAVASLLFFMINKITKNKLLAFLSSSFFAVTLVGIEATDWSYNFIHILGIGAVALFFIWYWKTKDSPTIKKNYIFSSLFFLSALVISPPRMHGMLPLMTLIEIGWLIIEGKKFKLKYAFLRLLLLVIISYIVLNGVSDLYLYLRDHFGILIGPFFIGNGYGGADWNKSRAIDGFKIMSDFISKGQTDFLLDPIATVGNYILPNSLWGLIPFSKISFLGKQSFTFSTYLLPISLFFSGIGCIVLQVTGLRKKSKILLYILCSFLWMMLIYWLQKTNINTFSYPRIAFALVGGISFIFTIFLFFILRKTQPKIAMMILLGLGWMFTPIIFPWLIGPYGIINAEGRYSVQQGAGVSIWMAVLFFILVDKLKKTKKTFFLGITYTAIFAFIFLNIYFSNVYLNNIATYRSKALDSYYWNIMTTAVPVLDNKGLDIFFLLTDQQSALIAENLRFGFFGRSSIYYNITDRHHDPFMVVNDYPAILSSVSDGKYLIKQGREAIPTSIDRIHAFILEDKQMTDVTNEVRARLKEDLTALKQGTLQLQPQVQ